MSAPVVSADTTADPLDLVTAGWKFAARLCELMAAQGHSVLLLGRSGVGKTAVHDEIRDDLAHLVVEWNGCGRSAPPPTNRVAYVLLSRPTGVSLHYRLPEHGDGLDKRVRSYVHPAWLR